MKNDCIRQCEECGELFDIMKTHRCELWPYLKWPKKQGETLEITQEDAEELVELKAQVDSLKEQITDLKNTNAELRKARGCDEIIFEQLKHKKEKAEAEVERQNWLLGQIHEAIELGLYNDAEEHINNWKAQQGEGGE